MNTRFKGLTALFLCLLACCFTACRKKQIDLGRPPAIDFKTGPGYYSVNDTIDTGTVIKIGVIVSSDGSPDDMRNLYLKRIIGDNDEETIINDTLTGANRKSFSKDYTLKLVTPGVQKYTFVILNTHGLINEKKITFTVRN